HTRSDRDWSSDVCSSDLLKVSQRTFGSVQIGLGVQVLVVQDPAELLELLAFHFRRDRHDPLRDGIERGRREARIPALQLQPQEVDRKSTRLNSSHDQISY